MLQRTLPLNTRKPSREWSATFTLFHPNKGAKAICNNIEEIVDLCWDEFNCLEKKTQPFDKCCEADQSTCRSRQFISPA
jgi:hypothetical protein